MKKTLRSAVIFSLNLFLTQPAHALEVLSPYVVKGELEVEQQGFITHDRNAEASNAQDYVGDIGYSPTSRWKTELETEFVRDAGVGNKIRYASENTENTFMMTEPGEYWIDTAAFVEFDFGRAHQANETQFGLLGAKTVGRVEETANLLLHKDFGGSDSDTATGLAYSSQTTYQIKPYLKPGFEIYGDTDGKEKFAGQQFQAGPGLFGKIHTYDAQAIKYQVAYLMGATPATADGTLRWKVEYEFYF